MFKITGLGIDIEEVRRFKFLPYRNNKSFYRKIFTPGEINYCLSKSEPAQHFAGRFAAKEAVIKAKGGKLPEVKRIEVINDRRGRPLIKLQTPNRKSKILISMSHTKDYAIALAICLN